MRSKEKGLREKGKSRKDGGKKMQMNRTEVARKKRGVGNRKEEVRSQYWSDDTPLCVCVCGTASIPLPTQYK